MFKRVGLCCIYLGVSAYARGRWGQCWRKACQETCLCTITKLASVPADPGFPEGVAVDGDKVFVSGPARFGTAARDHRPFMYLIAKMDS